MKKKKQLEKCSRMDRNKENQIKLKIITRRRRRRRIAQAEQRTATDANRHCNAFVFLEIKIQQSLRLSIYFFTPSDNPLPFGFGVCVFVCFRRSQNARASLSENCACHRNWFPSIMNYKLNKQTNCTCTTQLYSVRDV